MYFHVQITALDELCCVALSFEYFSEQNQSNQVFIYTNCELYTYMYKYTENLPWKCRPVNPLSPNDVLAGAVLLNCLFQIP